MPHCVKVKFEQIFLSSNPIIVFLDKIKIITLIKKKKKKKREIEENKVEIPESRGN